MSFPATNQLLADAYRTIKQRAADVRLQAVVLRDQSLSSPISANRILALASNLSRSKAEMAALASTPGLAAYAQSQENNPSLDIAAEYTAMIAQMDATVAWIVANFPQDANGYRLAFTLSADGIPVYRTFDTGSLVGLRSALDALIATIS